jgi:hypothetical protein
MLPALSRLALLGILLLAARPPGHARVSTAFREPIFVYNNWAAYDELSDTVELTEELALRQLQEVRRLRAAGVRIDYYVMDAYWFARDGGYRTWRTPNWPAGPDRWLAACREEGLLPGLWFSTNKLSHLDPHPAWADSLNREGNGLCLFSGGYLPHLMETLQLWYDRGVRLYKFDFASFTAVPPALASLPREEVIRRNETAWREALATFRARHPDAVMQAYNGYGGNARQATWQPFQQSVDLRWLEVFDSLYCGDPRPGDVPMRNFFRAVDLYSDHMLRRYVENGVPVERIDTCYPMIGRTGTVLWRGQTGWRGSVLLNYAHGSWMNVFYGDLALLSGDDTRWLARAQQLQRPLLAHGRSYLVGGDPGRREPYGFAQLSDAGALYTVVNPSQTVATVPLAPVTRSQPPLARGRVLFRDAGFAPVLTEASITLGPEQMAVIGYGRYAGPDHDLGVQDDVVIPTDIAPVALQEVVGRSQRHHRPAPGARGRTPAHSGAAVLGGERHAAAQPWRGQTSAHQPRTDPPLRGAPGRPPAAHHRVSRSQRVERAFLGRRGVVDRRPGAGEPLTVHATSTEPTPVRLTLEAYAVRGP